MRIVQKSGAVIAAALCLGLAACQQPMGAGGGLAMDASDPCQRERAEFAGSQTYFQDKIVTGAAAGAALGVAGGLAVGLFNGRVDAGTVIAGGVLGGVAGAGVAYYNTLAERARDQDDLANQMNQDLTREGQQIDHTTASFARLRACRFAAARQVKADVRAHAIDRERGLTRIAFLRGHFDEEINLAHQYGLSMANRGQQFQEAANTLRAPRAASAGQAAPRPVAGRASPQRVAAVNRAASVSVPEKRASFDSTVATAQKSSKAAFDIDNNASLSLLPSPDQDA